jgi:hypothetical protein
VKLLQSTLQLRSGAALFGVASNTIDAGVPGTATQDEDNYILTRYGNEPVRLFGIAIGRCG